MSAPPHARVAPSRSRAESTPAPAISPPHACVVDGVFYPCSDGRPMADNMWQAAVIMNAAGDLEAVRPQALVAADILVYPEEGNTKVSIGPDILVAFGLGLHKRSSYFVWREGKPPDWVLEVASPSTQTKDRDCKLHRYAAMGVAECWLFDPAGDVYPRRTPRLQGLRLVDGEYSPLESRLVGGVRLIRSEVLCLDIRVDGELLRFRDSATGRDVQHQSEEREQRKAAEALAETEANQRRAAEAQAEHEAKRRKAAEAQAEREAAQRRAAEDRIAALEAALRRSRAGHTP